MDSCTVRTGSVLALYEYDTGTPYGISPTEVGLRVTCTSPLFCPLFSFLPPHHLSLSIPQFNVWVSASILLRTTRSTSIHTGTVQVRYIQVTYRYILVHYS